MSDVQRGRVKFTLKDRIDSWWLAIEPMAGRPDVLKNGMFGFELGRPGAASRAIRNGSLGQPVEAMTSDARQGPPGPSDAQAGWPCPDCA